MNYLADTPNPFGLAGPPPWFLVDLAVFDADLVLFPSQEEAVYRLGRKVRHSPDIWRLVGSLTKQTGVNGQRQRVRPDSRVMAQHGLVPVTSILPSPLTRWGPTILQDLAAHDVQRAGGADAFTDALERQEARAEASERSQTESDLDALARSAYSDLVWQTGRRIASPGVPSGRSGLGGTPSQPQGAI